jgi:hypothetical protein
MRRVSIWLTGLILAAMMVGCSQSPSQNGTVTGTVLGYGGPPSATKAHPGPEPLREIKVTLSAVGSGTKRQTVTSARGTFTLSVPPGTYKLDSACGRAEPETVRVTKGARIKRTVKCLFV